MSKPINQCPKCGIWAAVGSKMHDCKHPTCTWNVCTGCKTTYDRYSGNFPKVAA